MDELPNEIPTPALPAPPTPTRVVRKQQAGPGSPEMPTGELDEFADGLNEFALALYGELRGGGSDNLFFSPFSVRTALSMVFAGARGGTAAELKGSLRSGSSEETFHRGSGDLIRQLNGAGGGEYEMAVANSLWGQDGAPTQPEFLDLVARHYDGNLNAVDFRNDAVAIASRINRWVEDKTKEKIQGLIGRLDAETSLVLVNAVYFKGMWVKSFSRTATSDQPFFLEDGGTVAAPLMTQTEGFRYVQQDGFQAVELRYRGDDLSMLVLLPDAPERLADLEARLSRSLLDDCVARMDKTRVKLFLPTFKVTWGTASLTASLRALGIDMAFVRGQADFSGINGYEPPHEDSLFVSDVLHKAFVEVNEQGTEAAAATAVGTVPMASQAPAKPPPIPVFRADHPFLFAIRDRKTSAILFLGRVTNPAEFG